MFNVSLIIPIYNVESYLARCLTSVINQTLSNIEIICINDGSTDDSLTILSDFAKNDSRIVIFDRDNYGLGATRNFAVNKAKGEYLLFVDSDDWIDIDTCKKLYTVAKTNNLDILQAKFDRVDDLGKATYYNFFNSYPTDKVFTGLNFFNAAKPLLSYNWDKLWNRDFFIENKLYNPEGVYYEDLATTFKGYICAKRVMYLNYCFYHYFVNTNSITNIELNRRHIKGRIYQFNAIVELLNKYDLWNHQGIAYSFINHLDVLLTIYVTNKTNNRARKQLKYFIKKERRLFRKKYSAKLIRKTKFSFMILLWFPYSFAIYLKQIWLSLNKVSPKFIKQLVKKIV